MSETPEERFRGLGAFDSHQSVPTPAPERPDRLREANERLVSAAQAIVTGWYGDGFDDYEVDELRAALAAEYAALSRQAEKETA